MSERPSGILRGCTELTLFRDGDQAGIRISHRQIAVTRHQIERAVSHRLEVETIHQPAPANPARQDFQRWRKPVQQKPCSRKHRIAGRHRHTDGTKSLCRPRVMLILAVKESDQRTGIENHPRHYRP